MKNILMHLIVSGRVQGVFFRAHTQQKAQSLNLTGWVRNLPDGSVEIKVKGPEKAVHELLEWCHKGPPAARVDQVKSVLLDSNEIWDQFHILR